MDCPQCRRECGQNDKFCSECGYKLCSANTPVTGSNRHTHSKRRSHTDNRLLGCCRAFICCQCTAQDEEERSVLESETQQRDTTPAEHITPGTPAPESEYQEETTDNRSSLGPEPAPEDPSLCLAQSQPSSADPDKSDAESGLVGTDDMDGTLREDTKYTVCTAQEEEEDEEEEGIKGAEDKTKETEDSKESVSVSKDETVSTDSDQQAHSDNHTHNDNHTHSKSQIHTHSDDHTHSKSLGHPDTGCPEDEAEETEDSKESVSVSKGETISKVSHAMPSPRRTSGASLPGGDLTDPPQF